MKALKINVKHFFRLQNSQIIIALIPNKSKKCLKYIFHSSEWSIYIFSVFKSLKNKSKKCSIYNFSVFKMINL